MATKSSKTGENVAKKAANPANKERPKEAPYATWTDPRTGWKYSLIKSWQAANNKPYARWFMWVEGYEKEYGDTYVSDLIGGLRITSDIEFDTKIWPDKVAFLAWAKGVELT